MKHIDEKTNAIRHLEQKKVEIYNPQLREYWRYKRS